MKKPREPVVTVMWSIFALILVVAVLVFLFTSGAA